MWRYMMKRLVLSVVTIWFMPPHLFRHARGPGPTHQ
ncbi:MAG: hypothetical protein CM15mP120_14400 [Pseudomonadota bacterium]|nr:MAG: hypothetical protein CM15mP120_14400 [Pseudomonadota bacterium]